MSFAAFLETAWNDHADQPDAVAARLALALERVEAVADIPPLARLITHVYGEHLARWQAGIDLLTSLRTLPCWDGSREADAAVACGIAVLRYAGAIDPSLADLPGDEQAIVLATAASALAGRRELRRAIAAYTQAVAIGAGPSAARALAVAGNNLAATLEEKPDRDAFETEGMLTAAQGGLHHWKLAGGWMEEERAEYRLARSLLQAGDPAAAADHARRCIAVCEANAAPAFERFFGHAVLALALRAAGDEPGWGAARQRAFELHDHVPADEREWCDGDLAEIRDPPTPAT